MICLAGFGDNASMFSPLVEECASGELEVLPINLPGFGAPTLDGQITSLDSLATHVNERAAALGANIVLAHSVASIIASLAAGKPGSPLGFVMSLEGNLTPEDAYFSGTAAEFPSANEFRPAFLSRLNDMAHEDAILSRYREAVLQADPQALWELGCAAHRFSTEHSPGALLQSLPRSAYLYNPDNVPTSSLGWLQSSSLKRYELPNASHWASIDQPKRLSEKIFVAIADAAP